MAGLRLRLLGVAVVLDPVDHDDDGDGDGDGDDDGGDGGKGDGDGPGHNRQGEQADKLLCTRLSVLAKRKES